jgi:hypothetical protein
VKLTRISDTTGGAPHRAGVISLSDATENGFFIFEEVQKMSDRESLPSSSPTVTVLHTLCSRQLFDPLMDTRFLRITQQSRWRFALKHPAVFREGRHQIWNASEVTLLAHEVCCYDEQLEILWKYDSQDGSLYTLRYAEATAALTQVFFATIPLPSQSCIGMCYVKDKEEQHDGPTTRFHLIIEGVSHLGIVSLAFRQPHQFDSADPQVALLQVQSVALRLSNVTCCCIRACDATRVVPEFWIGAGRSVFKFAQRENGDWGKSRIASFATTDVTAMAAQSANSADPGFTVAGMRNGTLQLLVNGARHHAKFDTTVRHRGSDIRYVYSVADLPYGFLSIARDGEAKVWDVRLLSQEREPVRTLLTSRLDGGQAGVCSAALVQNVLAVTCASTGLTCIDLPLYTTLFHTSQHISPTTRVFLGPRGGADYELLTFSPYFTQRFELCR